jgi:hypothetical protein
MEFDFRQALLPLMGARYRPRGNPVNTNPGILTGKQRRLSSSAMTDAAPRFDFLRFCRPGMMLKTRDRREARITAVAPESGLISGEVQMLGACAWLADGRFHQAPAGAAGPWDLMPPTEDQPRAAQRRESLAEALQAEDGNPGCCD